MTQKKKKSSTDSEKPVSLSTDEDADWIDLAAGEEPTRHLQGLKTVKEALRLEDFPMTKMDIDYAVGDIDIENGKGGFIPVQELTELFDTDEFDSPEEVIHALKVARRTSKRSAA
jgi:hypothetical protein